MTDRFDLLLVNARLATMTGEQGYGERDDAALGIVGERIAWIGSASEAAGRQAARVIDCARAWVTPGLIDCHTHVVYGGNRSNEFEQRLNGVAYEEIARAGGGIVATVRATRELDDDALFAQSLPRVRALLREGVTTLEIKSGYGLELEAEARQLRVARRIGRECGVIVKTTFLGAHAVPPEYAGRPDAYVDYVCDTMMPALAGRGLVDAVDAFCENIGFSPAQTARVLARAIELCLPVKLHAEQLSDQGGAQLAARHGALSVDHLEYLSEAGVAALARSGTVAVLLPGAFYYLRETRLPPIDALRAAGVPMALATDCNPGTSPIASPTAVMNMACTLFRLTPAEALAGFTRHAAAALGVGDETGTIETGKRADLAVWDIDRPADLAYALGVHAARDVIVGGRLR